jgi:hypothetical protein
MAHDVRRKTVQLAATLLLVGGSAATAQTPVPTPVPGSAATAPNVGQMAPDFTLRGATRYGLLKDSVKLSDMRGQTVVLAFFPKARTKG